MTVQPWIERWQTLDSGTRQRLRRWGFVLLFIALGLGLYQLSGRAQQRQAQVHTEETLPLPSSAMGEDLRHWLEQDLAQQRARLEQIEQSMERIMMLQVQQQGSESRSAATTAPNPTPAPDPNSPTTPATPTLWQPPGGYPPPATHAAGDTPEAPEILLMGGIQHLQVEPQAADPTDKKKRTVFLPPSFMPATLLTGIEALTVGTGEEDPETVMLRVQAPAVLPNSLKRNLRGCFVVANAYGRLARERVSLRVVSLHCMANNGRAAISQEKIKGYVVDEDGKRDLTGIVVSKAGAMLGRAFMAGVIGGLGNSVSISQSTTQTTPLGVTQIFDPQQALKSGLGSGIQSASEQLQNYFMELVRQSSPVIEVGAAKAVTVVITRGVHLEILEFDDDDDV